MEEKRLFFALETHTIWPESYPKGRILAEKDRHLTLLFLGNVDYEKFANLNIPLPNFHVGFTGKFDQLLFLPKRDPHVAAWHIEWLEPVDLLHQYYKTLKEWLIKNGFTPDSKHDFMPHVTIARNPHHLQDWKKSFSELPKLPMYTSHIHLYETLGHSQYASLWHHEMASPFTELDHTADIAYTIRGENWLQLYVHAYAALSFNFPPFLSFFSKKEPKSVEEIVIALNESVAQADQEIGCPFKAVSFHANVKETQTFLEWEMIVDV